MNDPTPSLYSFLAAYETDDNEWWRLGSGDHQGLFDAAVARAVTAETDLALACSEIVRWGERATTAETALATLKAAAWAFLRAPTHDNHVKLQALRGLLGVPDQPNPTQQRMCSGGDRPHPFVPGRDVDRPDYRSDEWCNTCGEADVPDQPNPTDTTDNEGDR